MMTYIKLFLNLLEALEPFSDDERGRLLTAMLEYAKTGEAPALAGNERFLFPMLRTQIDRDRTAYDEDAEEIHRARVEAGRMGGLAKASKSKQTVANVANANFAKKDVANVANVAEEEEEEKEQEEFKSNPNGLDSCASVVAKWNSLPDGIAKVTKIQKDSTRDRHLRKRIRDYGAEEVLKAVEHVRESDFLQGENDRGWVITFDWFIKPENFQKVLDGNYAPRRKVVPISEASYDINSAIEEMRTTVPTLRKKEPR